MSKVKFIQWGTDIVPKKFTDRWEVDEQNKPTGPSTSFSQLLSAYAGGVIFVTYTDANDKDLVQEIWANGVQYSVGGGGSSNGNIIYGTTVVDADGKAGTITGYEGYIYVCTQDKVQTAYYWKEGKWVPFNVEAENVWFHEDITLAGEYTRVGNFTKEQSGTAQLKTLLGKVGQSFNLQELMEGLLSKVVASGAKFSTSLSANQGAVGSLTIKNGETTVNNNDSFEVGTQLSVSAQLATNSSVKQLLSANTATYGYKTSETGTAIKSDYRQEKTPTTSGSDGYTLKKGEDPYSSSTFEVTNGSTTFTTVTTSAQYTGVAFDKATIIPLNNLGELESSITPTDAQLNEYKNDNLTPAVTSPSLTVNGYWPYFYGSLSATPTTWAQANLGSKKSPAFTSKEYEIPAGAKVAFVAIPEANSTKTISIKNSSTTASFSTAVSEANVTVTLGTQSQAYTVFYLAAASATGSNANFKITIS